MNMPFCDICSIKNKCIQDLNLFHNTTGNKRIPPEYFCKSQYEKFNTPYDDFQKKVLITETDNVHSLKRIYPEIKDEISEVDMEYKQFPLSVTLMTTEKCNLKCKYCYEVFSGNMKAKSMDIDLAKKIIDFYMSEDQRNKSGVPNWDIVGGELFVEFELLKQIVDYLINKYIELNLCPRRYLFFSLCTNGTLFTDEIKKWCMEIKNRIGNLEIGISLDGPKHVHDLNRCNSFDRIMENFDWWRTNFPNSSIKGTINPDTVKYLAETVRFYIEDLKLPKFYINPTFEGPWNEELAEEYANQLIDIATYFLAHPEYRLLKNSNVLYDTRYEIKQPRNWCGSGIHMRAVTPDGTIYPCLRAATSKLYPIGHIDTGVDVEKLKPFYFYTKYNDVKECNNCKWIGMCPSCVMEWTEDTGDLYIRSTKSCLMTKARLMVSEYYCTHTEEPINFGDD